MVFFPPLTGVFLAQKFAIAHTVHSPCNRGCSICECRGSLPLRGWFHRGRSQLCSPKGGESAGGMSNTPAFRVPITYIGKIVIAITYE